MKKFHFSLQKVMEVKQTEEKLLQKKLVTAEKDLYIAKEKQNEINDKIESAKEKQNTITNGTFSSSDYMNHYYYLQSLANELDKIVQHINKLQLKVEKARLELLEKVKEKKTLEKLKETKQEEYKKELKSYEQTLLDEIGITRNSKLGENQ